MTDTTSYGDGNVLPPLLISAGDTNTAALVVPALVQAGGSNGTAGAMALPALSVGTTNTGSANPFAILTLPTLTGSGTVGGGSAFGSLVLPALEGAGPDADGSLGDVDNGGAHTAELIFPSLIMSAVGTTPTLITASNVLPSLQLSAALYGGNVAAAVNALPTLILQSGQFTGNVATAALGIPSLVLNALGFQNGVLSFSQSVPPLILIAEGTASLPSNYQTWVLNTRKGALTSYGPEFQFNSYALFNGAVLGCGPSGVVVLGTQADDNGTKIDAVARTGKSDYDRSLLKRVPRLYIDYQTDGDMIFRTITSESGTRSYLLPTNNVIGFQQRRVPIGKGPKAAYWQYEMENVNGSDFTTRGIMAYPVMLRRRIM